MLILTQLQKRENMKIVCLDADTLGNDVDLDSVFGKFGEFVSYNMTDETQTIQRLPKMLSLKQI